MPTNWRQHYAILQKNKKRILAVCPTAKDTSGIYIMAREDENGDRYSYIGQSIHMLTRLAEHLNTHKKNVQHIDKSLKTHGLYDYHTNPYGWAIVCFEYPKNLLDEKEREYISLYEENNFITRNKTSGGQDSEKRKIAEWKPAKGYRDGLAQGYKNAQKEIANLFEKHLDFVPKKNPPTKLQEKAIKRFKEFLEWKNKKSM